MAWGVIFFPFLLLRPLVTLGLGSADAGSLEPLREWQIVVGGVLLLPVGHTCGRCTGTSAWRAPWAGTISARCTGVYRS